MKKERINTEMFTDRKLADIAATLIFIMLGPRALDALARYCRGEKL